MRIFLLTVALAAITGPVHAHYLWLESDGSQARAYYGEWENDIREKSGAALDRIASPQAYRGEGKQPLAIERHTDHLAIAASGTGDVVLREAGLAPREDKKSGGQTRTVFYAKAGRADTQARIDLDLVPVAAGANSFVLMFRGAPLGKATVTVYGPPKWEKTFRTDAQGNVTIETPWMGRYVIETVHLEETPGEFAGQKYDRLRHVTTLSFVVAEGAAAPSAQAGK